jgi:hypothetical protein
MKVNVALLKKVRKLIAEEPRRLKMHHWALTGTQRAASEFMPPCKTTACLAGWTILAATPKKNWWIKLFGHKNQPRRATGFNFSEDVGDRAARLLGIPYDECPFMRLHWGPEEVLNWIDEQIAKAK